jgi:GTP-binding protein Era
LSAVFRSGMVTIVGRPNVGKSTLLNRLVGRKVAITSDKPQTTRNRITGVLNRPSSQMVFIDTPGIHRPYDRLGQYMVSAALAALEEVEAIVFVVEAQLPPGPGDRYVAGRLKKSGTRVILVANKADLCPGETVRANVELYRRLGEFASVTAVSAACDEGFELLLRTLESILPEGPRYYPEGMITDQPEAFVIAELVREKVLALTRDEVPHSVAVVVQEMRAGGRLGHGVEQMERTMAEAEADAARRLEAKSLPDAAGSVEARLLPDAVRRGGRRPPRDDAGEEKAPLLYVRAVVYVERASQRGILVGAGGAMLRAVGEGARREIEALLGARVYLDLWVKVEKDWRDRAGLLRALGYAGPPTERDGG